MTRDPETAERLVAILTPLITEQSCGEWDDKTINEDVQMFLPPLLAALQEARNAALCEAAEAAKGEGESEFFNPVQAILALIDTPAPPAEPAGDALLSLLPLFVAAVAEAQKAMRKFPQPNYVISKVAEEAGEVVKAAIHCAEGRETPGNVVGEIKQTMAMLIRLCVEGDQVHGLAPLLPYAALSAAAPNQPAPPTPARDHAPDQIWLRYDWTVYSEKPVKDWECNSYVRSDLVEAALREMKEAAADVLAQVEFEPVKRPQQIRQRERLRAALAAASAPQADDGLEICPDCMGSGYVGHPEGTVGCYRCRGQGRIAPQPDADEREAMVRLLQIITRNGSLDDGRTLHEVIADALLAAGWTRKREEG